MAAITLNIGGNTRQLDRDIQKTVNKVYNINLKSKGDQPLGRITGKVNEFNKSLDASNARVIAFGASAGIIFGVERAFTALVSATIEVQKSLQDINVILNVSTQNLQKFGGELFNIARNTGQSFQEVAKAATEFSRQGLGVEETLKRTNEALILSRLSGLDAAKSVESLTAAVNSFASQAVTATEVVNKFATVDAAFAVSSADLADAIARVGSSAAQSGVSLNELIAIVTSAQQTTARGGAVIGNSFKTIFTRLQREKVVDLLGSLGISGTDSSGQVKSTIQLLTDLGKVYDTLGSQQQSYVAEQVGGVFQINILKAALADLGKEYSIYSSALNVAAGATDQAIRRNEELNKTYSAQINALQENARQLAAAGGERLLGPSIDRLVGGTNTLLKGFSESDGQGVGAILGKGILDGIGQFIAGPGIALVGGVLLKLFRDLAKFATGSVKELLGLNTAATQQRDLQQSINQILAKNPQLLELALKGEQGLNTAANSLLASLQKQTVELQKQAAVAAQISKALISQAGARVTGGVPVVPTPKTGRPGKAAGYIPKIRDPELLAARGENYNAQRSFDVNNPVLGKIRVNNREKTNAVPVGNYPAGSFVVNPNQLNQVRGIPLTPIEKMKNKASGFIPNFAPANIKSIREGNIFEKQLNKILTGVESDAGPVALDFLPKNSIGSLPLEIKKSLNINPASKYGDAKRTESTYSQQSLVSKVLRQFPNILNNKEPDNQNILDLSGSPELKGLSMLFVNRGTDKRNYAQLNTGGAKRISRGGGHLYGRKTANILQKNQRIASSKNNVSIRVPYLSDQIDVSKLPSLESGKRVYESKFSKKFASGFIPNFAQGKNAIDLGNLDTIPNKLGNKVVSLIYPGLSDGYSLNPATASYLKQEYTGKIPVAGINQKTLKSQLPDLDKNLGDLLVREANQFGQSLGGSNFLKSAEDLPNYGAAKGAVGVAFEGGVQTLLQQKVGRKQNAGIDFRNITPRLRSIFNEAPGMYDAKSSPALTNEVFKKLLNETRPGATVQKSSGQAGKEYAKKRQEAVDQLRKEGITGSVAIRQALRDRFGIVGKAAGFIPNFAAPKFLGNINFKDLPRATGKDLALRRKDINTNPDFKRQSIDGQILREYVSIIKKLGRTKQTEKLYRGISVPGKDFKKLDKQSIFNLKAGRKDEYRFKDFALGGMPGDEFTPTGIKDSIFDQVSQDFQTDNNWRMTSTSKDKRVARSFGTPDEDQEGYRGAYGQINFPKKRIVDDQVYKALLKKFPGKDLDIQRVLFRLARTHGGKGIAFDSQMVRGYVDDKAQLKREQDFPIYAGGYIPNFANPKLIEAINRRITNPNISTKLSEGSGLSNDAYIKAATKLGVNTSGLDAFLKQPGFPLKGRKKIFALSRALGDGWLGRSFNVDALKLGDWKYVQKQFEANGLTKNDFDQVSKFARSSRGERALKMGFKSQATKMREMEFLRRPGAAVGYIPNFAAIQAPLQNAVNNEVNSLTSDGIPKKFAEESIDIGQSNTLISSKNEYGLGVFSSLYGQKSIDDALKMHSGENLKNVGKKKTRAAGFIPNFAIEDPDTQAAGLGSSIGAVVAQLGFLAFSLQGSREQYKQSLEELTRTNVAQAKINSKNLRESTSRRLLVGNTAAAQGGARIRPDGSRGRDFSNYTGGKTGKEFGDLRRASRSPLSQQRRDEAARELRAARAAERTAARGTGGQKFAAASGAGGFALSLGAPVIAETIKNAIGQETAGARKTGAAVSAAGQVASFAGAGAMFGPWGVAIGAATGALLTVPGLIDEMTATAPEFAKAAAKASQDLTKFNDAGQRVLTSSSELSKLLKEGGSKNSIQKAQEAYNKSLLELSSVDRQRLGSAAKVGKLEEEYAKVLAEKVAKERSAQSETALAGVRDEIASDKTKTGLTFGAGAFALGNAILPGLGSTAAPFVGSIAATQKDYLNLGTEEGRKRRAGIAETFTTELRGNKGPEEFLKSLRDIKIPKEVTNKAQFDNFVNGLKELPTGFKNTLKEIAAEDPEAAFQLLRAQIVYLKKDTADFIKDSAALQAAEKERQDILKQEQAAIDATVSSIQKNIAVQNLWKSAIDNINESIRSFSEDLKITQTLTQPREVLGGLIGEDKTPTRRLAAQEGLARIDATTRSGLATSGIDFKETFRGITQEPFQENIDKIVKKLGEQGGALAGEPEDIIKQSTKFQSEAKAEEQKLLKATENMEAYLSKFISGQMSTNQLLEASKQELGNVGIDINRGSQASDSIEKAVAELQVKSIQEQVKAFQQRAKLASETKQAILQSRIEQALNTFGGFEGFMNRPEEEGNYIQRISPDLKKIEQIRSSTAFRYNNKDSIKEQEKQAPDLARSFANVYKELINQSGGAFRDFLQQTIDQGMQQTGVEGRSGLAGAGLAGGFDDIVRGRQQDLEQQLKLAEDQIKVTTDPTLKRDLQGFVDSVRNIPGGTKGIAQLQTQKELGVARQSDFAKLYGKYENESLNRLKDISPELAASLESAISLSDDPLVAEAQLQSALQTDMVGYLSPIQSALLQIANSGGASVTQTGVPKIEGYAPKLTEQQQKKADEFRKKQEEVAKKEADIKAKKAQEAAMPKDNRTIAEIEAETRNKRDQKYFQAQLSPTNRSTGKRFESIEEVDAEMRKALGLSAFNPDQKAYYTTLKNFKEKLNPTGGRSERGEMFMSYEKDMTFDPNSPGEIEKRTIAARDQRLAGIINPQQILGPNLGLGPNVAVGQEDLQNQIKSQIKPLSDIGASLRPLSEISNDVNRASYDMDVKRKGLYEGDFGAEVERRKLAESPLLTLTPQQVTTQGPQPLEQSFIQQEAAFSNNTLALTTLASSIETLNSTITNTQSTNRNVNTPSSQQAGVQPQVSTNTNAPVSVVVNAQGGTDISTAVGQAVQNAIPSIVEKVRIAMGEKVPPTVSRPPLTTNPKFGAGQRADGGFLL